MSVSWSKRSTAVASPARRVVDTVAAPLKAPLGAAVGAALTRWAVDITAECDRSCLVVAPHPDDETLGCGVTIMRRLNAGASVRVLIASDGAKWPPSESQDENRRVRLAELASAAAILGLQGSDVSTLRLPDGGLAEAGDVLAEAVREQVAASGAVDVFVSSPADPHPDHQVLGSLVCEALRNVPVQVLSYPVWQWTRPAGWLRAVRASGRPVRVSTNGYLERKMQAVACYRSQHSSANADPSTDTGLTPWFLARFLGTAELFFREQ